jgi:hypothetical protein
MTHTSGSGVRHRQPVLVDAAAELLGRALWALLVEPNSPSPKCRGNVLKYELRPPLGLGNAKPNLDMLCIPPTHSSVTSQAVSAGLSDGRRCNTLRTQDACSTITALP